MKKVKIILSIFIIACLAMFVLFNIYNNKKINGTVSNDIDLLNNEKNEKIEEYVNIGECTDEFMNEYFEEYHEIQKNDNKENILIITSKKEIENTYGSSKVVKAPNNQYYIQYENEEEKNNAMLNLLKDPEIQSVEENAIRTIYENDTLEITESKTYDSWGIEKMGLNIASEIANNKELNDITVAIIDTGCDMELFNQKYNGKIIETYNSLDQGEDVTDNVGHGTHIAGTIAEGTPDNVKIFPIKISNSKDFYTTDFLNALNYVTYYKKADVINMSFGGYNINTSEMAALKAANSENIICVAAAGNDNTSQYCYPASYDTTISVSACDSYLNKATFSNYGTMITFTAPGVNISSINGIKSGTSMATPHAVCAVAILKSYNLNYSKDDVIDVLRKYAIDLGTVGKDEYFGYGLISLNDVNYCECECDTCNEIECKGCSCSNCIYYSEELSTVHKIEVVTPVVWTTYNYGSITNFSNVKLKIYMNEDIYVERKLLELNNIEISGYDANALDNQVINISYKGCETSFVVEPQEQVAESAWTYEKIDESNIKIVSSKSEKYVGSNNWLASIYVPEKIDGFKVKAIGSGVFRNYTMESCYLPQYVTIIEKEAFRNNGSLKKLIASSSKLSVGDYAFYNNYHLEEINAKIISVGEYAFKNDDSLKYIEFDESCTSIGKYAFNNCSELKNIELPNGISNIGDYAFWKSGIENITLSEGLEEIPIGLFLECKSLRNIIIPQNVKKINDYAFENCTNLETIYIPKKVESINYTSLKGCPNLKYISVEKENAIYDSRNECNALIETSTNTLIKGSYNAEIPESIKIIGEYAFKDMENLKILEIPSGVTNIGDCAFENSTVLGENVVLPNTVTTIGDFTFRGCNNLKSMVLPTSVKEIGRSAFVECENITLWVYRSSTARTYAIDNSVNYKCINPTTITLCNEINTATAFDNIDSNNMYFELYYEDDNRTEIVDNVLISYQTKDSKGFRYGNTYYYAYGYNQMNYLIRKMVDITVSKAIPTYKTPTDTIAKIGQKLSDISLPTGFEWMDENIVLNRIGTYKYKAKYIPEDTNNYEIVENIDISVKVDKYRETIEPNIQISNKIYDGTNEIDFSNIIISNLNGSEYSIVSAISTGANVGNQRAIVKIRLSNNKFENYCFGNGKQEEEFTVDFEIIHLKISKPYAPTCNYVYNGTEITFDIPNYNENTMNIENNTGTNAGEYEVIVSLKNDNYLWDDGSSDNVQITVEIAKANIEVMDFSKDVTVKYDGKWHTINLDLGYSSDYTLKYIDSNNEYTLDDLPIYTEVGTYIIKYKIYFDQNHEEYYGERKLKILSANEISYTSSDNEAIYDGEEHTINLSVETPNYIIKYSINNTNYDLTELPTFIDVGEYQINYKISAENYEDVTGSNKVKIYGIKEVDSTITLNNNVLLITNGNNSFTNMCNKIEIFAKSYEIQHLNKNGDIVNEDLIKTGDKIKINVNNQKDLEYTIAILGDVNEDGKVNNKDWEIMYRYINGTKVLNEYQLLCADVNRDGKINNKDWNRLYNHINETNKLW